MLDELRKELVELQAERLKAEIDGRLTTNARIRFQADEYEIVRRAYQILPFRQWPAELEVARFNLVARSSNGLCGRQVGVDEQATKQAAVDYIAAAVVAP